MDLNDEVLMWKYVSGDLKAYALLYKKYAPIAYRYFLSKKITHPLAQELTQTVFLKLHQNKNSYQSHLQFSPWFFTLTRHTFLDYLKLNESKITQASQPMTPLNEPAFPETQSQNMQEFLKSYQLSADEKELLWAHFVEDQSLKDLALLLNKSHLSVRKTMSRIYKKIKLHLKGNFL